MRARRMACLILGLWLGAGLWMQWVTTENTSSVDSVLQHPASDAAQYLKSLGTVSPGPLAQYLVAEENRSLMETWGNVQIVLSAIFFFFLLFGTRLGKVPLVLALFLVLVVVLERVLVIPEMSLAGRSTDFALNSAHRVHLVHQALGYGYSVTELSKWVLAVGVAGILVFQQSRRSTDSRREFDLVDKANYRHIDR